MAGLGTLAADLLNEATSREGVTILQKRISIPSSHIKNLSFELKTRCKDSFFLVIGNESEEKASITILISDNLISERGLHAGNLVKELAKEIGGGGGGQAGMATAGGTNPAGIDSAIQKATDLAGL
jgi:alanyl-tRNA synthetase